MFYSLKKIISEVRKPMYTNFKYYFFMQKFNLLSINYRLFPDLAKIDEFEQKICTCQTLFIPLAHIVRLYYTFDKKFDFKMGRDHRKNFYL